MWESKKKVLLNWRLKVYATNIVVDTGVLCAKESSQILSCQKIENGNFARFTWKKIQIKLLETIVN